MNNQKKAKEDVFTFSPEVFESAQIVTSGQYLEEYITQTLDTNMVQPLDLPLDINGNVINTRGD